MRRTPRRKHRHEDPDHRRRPGHRRVGSARLRTPVARGGAARRIQRRRWTPARGGVAPGPRPARRRAAAPRRLRRPPRAAHLQRGAGHHADRPRRRGGQGEGPRARRRRLHHEAVRSPRAARPGARGPAAARPEGAEAAGSGVSLGTARDRLRRAGGTARR